MRYITNKFVIIAAWIFGFTFVVKTTPASLSSLPRVGYPSGITEIGALAAGGDRVYAAAGGSPPKQFAFSQLTGAIDGWNPQAVGGIKQILVCSNLVYVCGLFRYFQADQ